MNSIVYNMDCIAGMKEYPDKHFDLAIVDPPYGIGVNSMNMGGRKTIRPDKRTWDNEIPSEEYFIELYRVSKDQIIWNSNRNVLQRECTKTSKGSRIPERDRTKILQQNDRGSICRRLPRYGKILQGQVR